MLKPYMHKNLIEAGCDEAGRGCLVGRVYAAAVVLPKGVRLPLLNDSKKLNEATRDKLRLQIEKKAVSWAVAWCDEKEIDKINILNASILAMQKAVKQLNISPEHLLIDGNRFKPFDSYKYTTVIQGDGIYKSIAAASILAKTHRDEYMKEMAISYPEYGFDQHKGYATKKHRDAIAKFGALDLHRKSFTLKSKQIKLL
ncbi:MAG: ribonuclease HII [Bacteroidia bacterium]|nr:ribonuclease HII [Bacteroidia bacterium]NNJ56815.1 ribonuclease HII [Bacteroidia bacterium]